MKVVAIVYDENGQEYDQCYTWETAQTYSQAEGKRVKAINDDGHMTKEDIQRLCDYELRLYEDCWGGSHDKYR